MGNVNEATLTPHQKEMMKLDQERQQLTQKLRLCRAIMREHNIGHLYPGASEEHEKSVQESSRDKDNYFALQQTNLFNEALVSGLRNVISDIGIFLKVNAPDILARMPLEVFEVKIGQTFEGPKETISLIEDKNV